MPELPEVEVSRLGITPYLVGQIIKQFIFRVEKLRWEIPEQLKLLEGHKIERITRRAKYLLIETKAGTAIVHLGMSGNLRVLDTKRPDQNITAKKHDHVDLVLNNGVILRYHDPRRFGSWLWSPVNEEHAVLAHLGPEPLTEHFSATDMHAKAQRRKITIKQFIMDNKMVVGVGNIYACESLFKACIHPLRPANQVSIEEWQLLVTEIKSTLASSIEQGGTTLKDFAQTDGKPGYFVQQLQVYGKAGEPCSCCGTVLSAQNIGQRNTFFCEQCQR